MAWVLLFLGGWWIYHCKNISLRRALWVAYGLRCALALEHYHFFPLPDSQADALTFIQTATLWSQKGTLYLLTHVGSNAWLYVWGLAWVFLLFGVDPFLAQMINVLIGTGVVKLTYRTSRLLWGPQKASRAAWAAALMPLLLLYSAIPMREPLLVFTFLWGVEGWLKWHFYKGKNGRAFLQWLFGFLLSTKLHTAMMWGFVLPLFSFLLFAMKQMKKKHISKFVFYNSIILGGILITILKFRWGLDYIMGLFRTPSRLAWLQHYLIRQSRGHAAYLQGVVPHSWGDIIWMTPLRMLYFLCAPFPWMIRQPQDMLGIFNAGMWCLLLFWLFKKSKTIWRRHCTRFLLLTFIGMWFMLAWGTSNYGTALRHGVKLLPLILVLLPFPRLSFSRSFSQPA